MTTFGTRLLTWLRGELVGTDAYGNAYYRLKGDKPTGRGGGRFSRDCADLVRFLVLEKVRLL